MYFRDICYDLKVDIKLRTKIIKKKKKKKGKLITLFQGFSLCNYEC